MTPNQAMSVFLSPPWGLFRTVYYGSRRRVSGGAGAKPRTEPTSKVGDSEVEGGNRGGAEGRDTKSGNAGSDDDIEGREEAVMSISTVNWSPTQSNSS